MTSNDRRTERLRTHSRRKILRTAGIAATAGVAATVPVTAASDNPSPPSSGNRSESGSDDTTVEPQLHEGQRVTDCSCTDYAYVNVFAAADPTSEYLGTADGGQYNDPYGTTTSGEVDADNCDCRMIEVDWETGPDGWCYVGEVSPVVHP